MIFPILVLCLGVMVAQLMPLFQVLRPFDTFDNKELAASCELLGDSLISNSEDLTLYKFGKMFISAGNLVPLIGHVDIVTDGDLLNSNIDNGNIAMVTIRDNAPSCVQVLKIDNFPDQTPFHPHGIYYSNITSKS